MRITLPRWTTAVAATLALASNAAAQRPSAPGFRVLQWNVSDSAWVTQADATRAVLRHADADIFVFVQVSQGMDAAAVRRVLSGLRGPRDTTWFVSSRGAGDFEHTVIASRDTVREAPEFETVRYPTSGSLAARAAIPDSETPAKRDAVQTVRANGALVRAGSQWIFIVGIHLMCCGTPDTWREYRRQLGAATIGERLRAALSRTRADGVIAAGDMNLVAGRAPLDTILGAVTTAPLGPMRRADAVQDDGWTDWTWDGRGTAFNGGRLDNVIYSAGTLSVARARIWDTEFMSPDTLRAHQLTPGTSKLINRHRPVVVDLMFRR